MLIINAKVFAPDGIYGWIRWEGKMITGMGNGTPPPDDHILDAKGLNVLAGFIDIHIHGCMGHDVMDATPEALAGMAAFLAGHGVTSFLPTTLTHTREHLRAALQNIKMGMVNPPQGAVILGGHLEGPYLNKEKCGAQNPDYIRLPQADEVIEFLEMGVLRLVDVAPEFIPNELVIEECVARGITVSVAHSSATYSQVLRAIELGLSHSTHTFNAQTPLNHRDPNIVGAVLSSPHITCELIADNIHIHPAVMKILWLVKRPHHLVLISDAVRAAGMVEGDYQFDERVVRMETGAVRLLDGTLAGSILTLDRALHNLMKATGEPLENVWQTASLNPARAIKVAHHKGSLEIGKDADLVMVDDDIHVKLTIVEGKILHQTV